MIKKVRDVMTPDVETLEPSDSVEEAARKMRLFDAGLFPVCETDRVVGVLTDRDITLRVTAEGRDPAATRVADVMTREPACVGEDADLWEAARVLCERRVRRLPVLDRRGRLVGLISVGRLAKMKEEKLAGHILKAVVGPRAL